MSDLNLSNYTTTASYNFNQGASLSDFPLVWANNGNISYDGDGITLSAGSGGGVGFLQAPYGAGTYGLYQVTAKLDAGQGNGAAVVLWPSDNVWPGPEVDLMESFDTTRQSAYTTIHWNNNGSDSYDAHNFQLDATQWHTYAYDWEPGSLTYYIDGHEMFSTTDHVPSSPLEFGAEIAAPDGNVNLHIQSMSISQPNGGASAQAPDQAQAPAPAADTVPAASLSSSAGSPGFIPLDDSTTTATGSGGNDTFAYTGTNALDVISNFSVSNGDVLQLPAALQSSIMETQVGNDLVVSFGNAQGGMITLQGVNGVLPDSAFHFV